MFNNPWKENRLLRQLLAAKDETIRTLEQVAPIDTARIAKAMMDELERLCRELKGEGPATDFRIGEERGLRRRVLHRLLENLDNPAKMRSLVEKELALSKERQQALEVADALAVRRHLNAFGPTAKELAEFVKDSSMMGSSSIERIGRQPTSGPLAFSEARAYSRA